MANAKHFVIGYHVVGEQINLKFFALEDEESVRKSRQERAARARATAEGFVPAKNLWHEHECYVNQYPTELAVESIDLIPGASVDVEVRDCADVAYDGAYMDALDEAVRGMSPCMLYSRRLGYVGWRGKCYMGAQVFNTRAARDGERGTLLYVNNSGKGALTDYWYDETVVSALA